MVHESSARDYVSDARDYVSGGDEWCTRVVHEIT